MTEEEATEWIRAEFDVPRETMTRLDDFAALLVSENERQNLVSRGTLPHLWARHFLDSAQLLRFAPSPDSTWLDLGTGAGFPGMVVAALHRGPVTMVESRRLRVEFLHRAAEVLGVSDRTTLLLDRVERVPTHKFDVISARAFAPMGELLELAHRFSTEKTRWILPKGRSAQSELEAAESSWQGSFRLEPSLTDPDSGIIVADGVTPQGRKRA
ncbi:16S rRNA (guanine(527)-N(7))-methyltransferase RsmG [Sphingosinicella sp. YJ22]|uniref:16S rRNA (guanine(527)-N(7))-methyltransferase RsmG n=1 Tax=Sphingosinicella sp. YJ22 TaxID=1104780 RepID=UPI00140780EA|nr:16S rRNA (guanine(527)-N(7))-methyltransferase RsmG [Sphingosinicella sp. YJ22]